MKSVRQIIAEHIADYAVDEPGTNEWEHYVTNADRVIEDLLAEGYVITTVEK